LTFVEGSPLLGREPGADDEAWGLASRTAGDKPLELPLELIKRDSFITTTKIKYLFFSPLSTSDSVGFALASLCRHF
jgi:hypothetical protein